MTDSRDELYASPRSVISRFRFDEQVARVFPDMINRSVPGYGLMLEMIGVITARYAQPGSRLYDLGCSLGASTLAMRQALPDAQYHLIGVDNSAAMIDRCREILARDSHPAPVELRCEDVQSSELRDASVVTLNFTLQFIPLEQRVALLERIATALRPGGALILSEKLASSAPEEDRCLIDLHHDFKRSRGYSDLEIAQKRAALEEVLRPEAFESHRERLHRAGFSAVYLWFQCFNFASILALK